MTCGTPSQMAGQCLPDPSARGGPTKHEVLRRYHTRNYLDVLDRFHRLLHGLDLKCTGLLDLRDDAGTPEEHEPL